MLTEQNKNQEKIAYEITSDTFVTDANSIRNGYGYGLNLSEVMNIPLNKRHSGVYFVAHYEKGSTTPLTGDGAVLCYLKETVEDADWKNIANWSKSGAGDERPILVNGVFICNIDAAQVEDVLNVGGMYTFKTPLIMFTWVVSNYRPVLWLDLIINFLAGSHTMGDDCSTLLSGFAGGITVNVSGVVVPFGNCTIVRSEDRNGTLAKTFHQIYTITGAVLDEAESYMISQQLTATKWSEEKHLISKRVKGTNQWGVCKNSPLNMAMTYNSPKLWKLTTTLDISDFNSSVDIKSAGIIAKNIILLGNISLYNFTIHDVDASKLGVGSCEIFIATNSIVKAIEGYTGTKAQLSGCCLAQGYTNVPSITIQTSAFEIILKESFYDTAVCDRLITFRTCCFTEIDDALAVDVVVDFQNYATDAAIELSNCTLSHTSIARLQTQSINKLVIENCISHCENVFEDVVDLKEGDYIIIEPNYGDGGGGILPPRLFKNNTYILNYFHGYSSDRNITFTIGTLPNKGIIPSFPSGGTIGTENIYQLQGSSIGLFEAQYKMKSEDDAAGVVATMFGMIQIIRTTFGVAPIFPSSCYSLYYDIRTIKTELPFALKEAPKQNAKDCTIGIDITSNTTNAVNFDIKLEEIVLSVAALEMDYQLLAII